MTMYDIVLIKSAHYPLMIDSSSFPFQLTRFEKFRRSSWWSYSKEIHVSYSESKRSTPYRYPHGPTYTPRWELVFCFSKGSSVTTSDKLLLYSMRQYCYRSYLVLPQTTSLFLKDASSCLFSSSGSSYSPNRVWRFTDRGVRAAAYSSIKDSTVISSS